MATKQTLQLGGLQWQQESCTIAWDQWILHGLGNSALLKGILRSYPMYPSFVSVFLNLNA